MTNKEFEDKKQFIIGFIESGIAERELIMNGHERALIMDIKALQPPKPTCSTCDHCEHHEIDCGEGMLSDCYRCLSDKLDWNMLPYIEEPTNFGCIHHSDYEVAE